MRCGLLGRKLGHSYSPAIHAHLGDYSYDLFEKEPDQLADFLRCGDFDGINVTMPYKKDVIVHLDELTPAANALGAVNTIVRRDGRLIGHNTDLFGFQSMLQQTGISVNGKKCLVCGSGGASNTVCAVLRGQGGQVVILSRSGTDTYNDLQKHSDAAFVVNCTPLGMYPNVGQSPLDLNQLPALEAVLDVVYNPARTALLLEAEKRGLVTMNGLWMLVAQAVEASAWFLNGPVQSQKIPHIYNLLRKQMENIVLIGMPGCGKSTIGQLLAAKLGKQFVDTDSIVEELSGSTIAEIFRTHGEAYFRTLERQSIARIGKESGLIIATGGGCVTQQENYHPLHQNGTLYWIQRDIDVLPTDGRPLSQAGALQELYARRESMYQQFADHIINNNATPAQTVQAILETEGYL